jgi:hypothetical protein
MMNFTLGAFWDGLKHLQHELQITREHVASGLGLVIISEDDRSRLQRNMQFAIRWCVEELQLQTAERVCSEIRFVLVKEICRWSDINTLLEELWKTLEWETKLEHFFHYYREDAKRIENVDEEWKSVISAFPSSRKEIIAALDCFALGDYPGCVFHMMRIAELGLRAIAGERGIKKLSGKRGQPKPIEWGTWNEVFDAIENQLKVIRQGNQGPKRDAALSFYDTALSDLRRMRDLYRDPTMHFRETYNKGEAHDAIVRANGLMTTLAPYLNETKPRKIRWGL